MTKVYLEDTTLTNIGNAIREKTGSAELLLPSAMTSAIEGIPSGGDVSEYFVDSYIASSGNNFKWSNFVKKIPPIQISGNNLSNLFERYYGLEIDTSSIDTSNAVSLSGMFSNCSKITTLDLRCFDTNKVTSMSNMFVGCYQLAILDVSSFVTSKVTMMNSMFAYCNNLESLDLSSFNTNNVTNMSSMFSCSDSSGNKLETIIGVLDMVKVTNASQMFQYCKKLKSVYLKNIKCNLKISDSILLEKSCIDFMLNNVQEVSNLTITLGSENMAKASEEAIENATNKGWVIN